MSNNPLNLLVLFLLEISALVSMGVWGWNNGIGNFRFVLSIGIPIIAATIWGIFRVPNDPGKAPIAIPGLLRLVYEFIFFGFATWSLFETNFVTIGWIFISIIIVHYFISYDRIFLLVKHTKFGNNKP